MDFGIARAIADTAATMTQTAGRHRHRAVPLARAGAGPDGRRALRPLLGRLHALRAAHRPAAVRRRQPGRDRLPARRRAADAAVALVEDSSPSDLDAVVLHSLAKPREDRYQDADAFRDDLAGRPARPADQRAAASAPPRPSPVPPAPRSPRRCHRGRAGPAGVPTAVRRTPSVAAPGRRRRRAVPRRGGRGGAAQRRGRVGSCSPSPCSPRSACSAAGCGTLLRQPSDVPQVTVPAVDGTPEDTARADADAGRPQGRDDRRRRRHGARGRGHLARTRGRHPGRRGVDRAAHVVRRARAPSPCPTSPARPLDEARAALAKLGLALGDGHRGRRPTTPRQGQVISSRPARQAVGGQAGTKVNLSVATGKVDGAQRRRP